MQDAGEDSATQKETDDAHILKDCPCDCKPFGVWESVWICAVLGTLDRISGSRPSAITAHNSAAIAFQKPDWTKWRQQDRAVEEVRCGKELRRCENVPDSACRCRYYRAFLSPTITNRRLVKCASRR